MTDDFTTDDNQDDQAIQDNSVDQTTPSDQSNQDDFVIEPKENPVGTDHLSVAGEVGVGPTTYHDPLTHDTSDDSTDGKAYREE